jgi:hypothetical protein
MFLRNGSVFDMSKPLDVDGVQYPAGWFTTADQETLSKFGITEVANQVALNPEFYYSNMQADGTFITTEKSAEVVRSVLLAKVSAKRRQVEVQGIKIGNSIIATDRDSQAMIGNAYSSLKNGLISSINFKSDSGFVNFDLAGFEVIAKAVAEHVQSCFTIEMNHVVALSDMNLTFVQLIAYDVETGWPAAPVI